MSSLVDYGDSDDDGHASQGVVPKKRFEHPISDRPKKIARTEQDVHRPREVSPLIDREISPLVIQSNSDTLKESECIGDTINEKNNLEKIELSPESIGNLRENVKKLVSYHGKGRSILHHIGESAQFQNPYCLETIMSAFKINPYCSNFPTFLYDPEAIEMFEARRFAAKCHMATRVPVRQQKSSTPIQSITSPKVVPVEDDKNHTIKKTKPLRRSNKWDVKQ